MKCATHRYPRLILTNQLQILMTFISLHFIHFITFHSFHYISFIFIPPSNVVQLFQKQTNTIIANRTTQNAAACPLRGFTHLLTINDTFYHFDHFIILSFWSFYHFIILSFWSFYHFIILIGTIIPFVMRGIGRNRWHDCHTYNRCKTM